MAATSTKSPAARTSQHVLNTDRPVRRGAADPARGCLVQDDVVAADLRSALAGGLTRVAELGREFEAGLPAVLFDDPELRRWVREYLIFWRVGAGAVLAGNSLFFVIRGPPERARDVSVAVTELSPGTVCALSLAADVAANVDRDDRQASSLLDRALGLTDEDADRVTLADHLVRLGRAADALAIVDELHLDDPEDEDLEAIRAAALMLCWRRTTAEPGDDRQPQECSEGPQRWLRGSVSIGDGTLEVDVDSRERFERLLSMLADAGGAPEVVKQLVIDPAQDMTLPHLASVLPGPGSQEASEAWRRHWPDQQLPALGGMTPRQAARTQRRKPWLGAMLRELEHDADRLAHHGRPAPDVASLCAELAMPVTAFM